MLFETIRSLIVMLRRREDVESSWTDFDRLVKLNINEILESFNSRWLVSICDTYADYGSSEERKNAVIISTIANFERLWATNLLMYDVTFNPEKLEALKERYPIELWDGMTSFAICNGDTTNNLFGRIESVLADTPVLFSIYKALIKRISENETVLANLNAYHKRLFETDYIPKSKSTFPYKLIRYIKRKLNKL